MLCLIVTIWDLCILYICVLVPLSFDLLNCMIWGFIMTFQKTTCQIWQFLAIAIPCWNFLKWDLMEK